MSTSSCDIANERTFQEEDLSRKPENGEKVLNAISLDQALPSMESSRLSGTVELPKDLNKFSTYRRYVNVYAWIYRFARNLLSEHKILEPKLTEDERQYGEKLLLRSIQKTEYAQEYLLLSRKMKTRSTLINQLGLFLSFDNSIRCKGRM